MSGKQRGNVGEKRSRSGKTGCSVVSCPNTYSNTEPNIKFYSFPSKPYLIERRQKWIKAVNRINPDGTPWQPTNNSRICSHHFVGGNKSEHPHHPAYNPTIFPSKYKRKEPSNTTLSRFDRWMKRKLVSEVLSGANDGQEQVLNETVRKSDKSVQVVSFQSISDDFIFSCDFDHASKNVSTQATISSIKNLKAEIMTQDKSSGPDIPILLSGFRGNCSIKNNKQLLAVTGGRQLHRRSKTFLLPSF